MRSSTVGGRSSTEIGQRGCPAECLYFAPHGQLRGHWANQGGAANPNLDEKMEPLNLTEEEIDALVAFMEALDGEGYQDTAPVAFPQ